ELVRTIAIKRGAIFGIHRLTFNRLAGLLAAEHAVARGLAYVNGLGVQAVAARALFALKGDPRLAPLGDVVTLPGLPRAIAATHAALQHARVPPDGLAALGGVGAALAAIFAQLDRQLDDARLIDRAGILAVAITALRAPPAPPYAAIPILMLD